MNTSLICVMNLSIFINTFMYLLFVVERPWILHTNNAAIDRLEMETWTNSTLVTGLRGAVAVDYHYTSGFMYYSEQAADRITRQFY